MPSNADPDDQLEVDQIDFTDLLELEPHGPDTFVASAPRYPWGRLFGGQVVAQALRAAQQTVDDDRSVHSLHAYFIRGGTHREPVRLEVDRIRNGRSFLTRRVVARQSNGAILNLACSFHVAEDAPDVSPLDMPADVAHPDDLADQGWGGMLARRPVSSEFGRTLTWIRLLHQVEPDRGLAACALAFISDAVPTGAVRVTHPIQVTSRHDAHRLFMGASLDHSIYFHRPFDPSQWTLADVTCHGLVGARGLTVGNLFAAGGVHTATIVQEVLLRERRSDSGQDGLGGKDL